MSGEAVAVMSILGRLQERARRLEKEAAELRSNLEQVTEALSRPVTVYEIDDERVVITEADVEAVRAQLAQPHPKEAIRAEAIAKGLAIDDPMEAVVGD